MSLEIANEKNSPALPTDFTGITGRGKADLQVPSQINPSSSLNEILIFARQQNASDVHLGALKPIVFRQFGQLKNITAEPLDCRPNHALDPHRVTQKHFGPL